MSAAPDLVTTPLELVLGESLRRAAGRRRPRPGAGAAVPAGVETAHRALDALADSPVWALSSAETGDQVVALERLTAKVAALQARLLAHASREAGRSAGESETGPTWSSRADLVGWLAEALPVTRAEATRRVVLARDLDDEHGAVATALAAGIVSRDQAAVIVGAVEKVPADATVDRRPARTIAAHHLVDAARTWHVPALRRLGRRILEVVDPAGAEQLEANRLAAEEARAEERCSFSMAQDAHGSWVGRFVLPELTGSMLHKALSAIANPARDTTTQGPTDVDDVVLRRRAPRLRLGEAFAEYVERFPSSALPAAAGGSATVVVTTSLDALRDELAAAAADLDSGGRLSAGETRRLACTAGIVPLVLGGASQPLDLGRERRLHSRSQRLALTVRDQGCRAVGCDWPPGMCHAHHLRPWSRGGPTTVDDGLLLCPRHHRQAHQPGTTMTLDADRRAHFTREAPR